MNDLRKAAEMALDYIEQALAQHDQQYQRHPSTERDRQVIVNDLEALRQALAQPEQYRCYWVEKGKGHCERNKRMGFDDDYGNPKREWVGLTDEEINLIYAQPQTHAGQYAKAIEAKLKEKNT